MTKYTSLVFVGLILFTASSCHFGQNKKSVTIHNLQGVWQAEEGPLLYEEWIIDDDSTLIGLSYSINGEDTLLLEKMRMVNKDGRLHFFARVPDQNAAEEIGFALVKLEKNRWTFENPDHDYPNRIIYELLSDTTLYARIENMKGNKQKEFRFKLVK